MLKSRVKRPQEYASTPDHDHVANNAMYILTVDLSLSVRIKLQVNTKTGDSLIS